MRNALKVLLIVLYLLAGYDQYLQRLADLENSGLFLRASYVGLFSLLALSLLLTAFIRSDVLRWFFAVLFATAAVFCDSYIRITGSYLTYSIFVSHLYSASAIDEALLQYLPSVLTATGLALLLLLGVGMRPAAGGLLASWDPPPARLSGIVYALAPLLGLALLTAVLFQRGGAGARGLPVMYTPIAYLKLFAYERQAASIGPRQPVTLGRTDAQVTHDIVFVIDESITGNYLALNAPHGVRTPLDDPPPGIRVFNYGYAAAISSCSADVNLTLRHGGTRSDYIRINASMPSVWQYAKAAGLETIYIDAQRTDGRLHNLMTDQELSSVDRFIQFDKVSVRERDMAVADALAGFINDDTPQLVLVNKMGAHFPVHDKFPDEFMFHQPVLSRGSFLDVGDTGLRRGFGGNLNDWALYRNSYRNTLHWNVGEFFRRLFAATGMDKAVMIYTSDHGQDLHERGNPGLNTHCGGDPVIEEGLVPLVVIQGSGLQSLDWNAHLAGNKDRSSHYNIFPTLLQLMGYDLDQVREVYGNPLSIPTEDPFTFNIKFNGRMGAEPAWRFIDLTQVVTPPPPD
jgi:glucan phosphoethanolaminetransferase (alkaline phosphatase superfamily)